MAAPKLKNTVAQALARWGLAPGGGAAAGTATDGAGDNAGQGAVLKTGEAVGQERRFGLRHRLGISAYLTGITFVAVLVPSLVAGFNAYHMQYRKSLTDTWALLFLESEATTRRIETALQRVTGAAPGTPVTRPELLARQISPDSVRVLEGPGAGTSVPARMLGAGLRPGSGVAMAVTVGRITWLVREATAAEVAARVPVDKRAAGMHLVGWRLNPYKIMRELLGAGKLPAFAYLATRGGTIVYASQGTYGEKDLLTRPLMKRFVESNHSVGSLEFDDEVAGPSYGFFREIPGTNLVYFEETTKDEALAALRTLVRNFVLSLFGILTLALVAMQLPLRGITRPIHELVVLTREISRGNFNVLPRSTGWGELAALTATFRKMATDLVARDRAIQTLMKEQQEKIRLEREFTIAKNLQDGFLPRVPMTQDSGLILQARYQPAAQVAGDWYMYHWDPKVRESVIVMADVSGHDMAASMFTAIIASVFHEYRQKSSAAGSRFPEDDFLASLHEHIRHFGLGKWHATVQMVTYVPGETHASIVNCGHTFPIVVKAPVAGGDARGSTIKLPSNPLGLEDRYEARRGRVDLTEGATLLLYTDGLVEAKRKDGKRYGTRRAVDMAAKASVQGPLGVIDTLIGDCLNFRAGRTVADADDLCLIALRTVSTVRTAR